jgi:SAM-dependent methyltransferase
LTDTAPKRATRRNFDADAYAANLDADIGFEVYCSRARQSYNLRELRRFGGRTILDIGGGDDPLVARAIAEGLAFDRWVVVEPSRALAQLCRDRVGGDPRVEVAEIYSEDLSASPLARQPFDVVLVSGVLHYADDPAAMFAAAVALGRSGALVVATAPNAWSFHRLLAVEMGVIDSPHSLEGRNARFRHAQVFDPDSLRDLMIAGGVGDLEFEGYLFKPFTHAQMEAVLPLLPADFERGLEALGRRFPRNAAEIAYRGVKA